MFRRRDEAKDVFATPPTPAPAEGTDGVSASADSSSMIIFAARRPSTILKFSITFLLFTAAVLTGVLSYRMGARLRPA